MADSNSHQPRCPCGFWGTPQTMGMCSKCYKEHQKKNSDADDTNGTTSGGATAAPPSSLTPSDLSRAFERVAASSCSAASSSSTECASANSSSAALSAMAGGGEEAVSEAGQGSDDDKDEDADSSGSSSNKRDISELQEMDSNQPVQKNKKRCFKCKIKLELALREIGRCKCDYVFCQLHRLPEQHDCIFDHKEIGRKEARDKMVSPKKHAGTSIKRMDSYS